MTEEDTFEQMAGRVKTEVNETMLVIARPYFDIEQCAILLGKEKSESFYTARDAYAEALKSRHDKLLRAKAFRAFAACYLDIGLAERSVEMTKKWQDLAREALEP